MPLHRLTPMALAGLMFLATLVLAAPSFAQEAGNANEPAYGTLADLIEDESSRNALIKELRALQAARTSPEARQAPLAVEGGVPAERIAARSPSDQQPEEVSFARRMAATTGNLAGNMGEQFAALGAALGGLVGAGQAQADEAVAAEVDLQQVGAAAVNLAILVIAT
ncbi:MAG TPA: mechanosensitive ion channel protein MscS, partial [Alcanivorax sp.]|nr:mechanosensitive ion channel protein MscS [Alcanivorax sp.]